MKMTDFKTLTNVLTNTDQSVRLGVKENVKSLD